MTTSLREAAQLRAEKVQQRSHRPSQRRCAEDPAARAVVRVQLPAGQQLRSVTRNGQTVVPVGGHASVTEAPYEMYDVFGPYSEVVSRGAFEQTLAASPLVEFTVNHGAGGGMPMAHTRNDTLELAEDDHGLTYTAFVDPQRSDVANMLRALERGDLAEASFKFSITQGIWSPDYAEFRINQVDMHGGDVSAVNFGANPAATSGLRARRADVRAAVRRDLLKLAGRAEARALNKQDAATIQALLSTLAAADAAIDPIADAICHADYGLDTALMTLSAMLGVPNPDADAPGGPLSSENDAADDLARARTRALLTLALSER